MLLDSMFLSDLKRFSDSNIRTSKLSTYVNFPLKELDLREFASESSGEFFLFFLPTVTRPLSPEER